MCDYKIPVSEIDLIEVTLPSNPRAVYQIPFAPHQIAIRFQDTKAPCESVVDITIRITANKLPVAFVSFLPEVNVNDKPDCLKYSGLEIRFGVSGNWIKLDRFLETGDENLFFAALDSYKSVGEELIITAPLESGS